MRLNLILADIVITNNEILEFKQKHEKEFKRFAKENGDAINIFVAINYDGSDEVVGIKKSLDLIGATSGMEKEKRIRFHFAEDKNWLTELYSNLMFYMIGCDTGLVFFTASNEYGFLLGLGKKCAMLRQKDVTTFTDVTGLLTDTYESIEEVDGKVKKFLRMHILDI